MQRTAHFHDHIPAACFTQEARVMDEAAALHAAVDGLDADTAARHVAIGHALRMRECAAKSIRHSISALIPTVGMAAGSGWAISALTVIRAAVAGRGGAAATGLFPVFLARSPPHAGPAR